MLTDRVPVPTAVPRSRLELGVGAMLVLAWGWAIWAAAEHWRGNPNYSFGWVVPVLAAAFAARRIMVASAPIARASSPSRNHLLVATIGIAAAAATWLLEFSREQVRHPELVIWTLTVSVVVLTAITFVAAGGMQFARALFFPIAFFLTAVPWPPRIEQPITSSLMQSVAAATTETLQWLGVQAEASGGAIALHDGIVGVTEACSGIRSLQSGIMFGLAMGEWFLLSAGRRAVLLIFAVICALATNFGRTLLLALHADRHGVASVESVHDLIGNIMVTLLIVAIWLAGKLMSNRRDIDVSLGAFRAKLATLAANAAATGGRVFAVIAIALVVGLSIARGMSARIDATDHAQLTPFFSVRGGDAQKLVPVPRDIWNELRPSSGEYVRVERKDLPLGSADSYHFFWKPSPWNRFALVHRPDICMRGIGWQKVGEPQPVQVDFGARGVRCYAFRFRRGNVHALELWGLWRNGDAVPLQYTPDQALGSTAPPPELQLEGRRRSATEIVACSVISENEEPPTNIAVELMRSVFEYSPR